MNQTSPGSHDGVRQQSNGRSSGPVAAWQRWTVSYIGGSMSLYIYSEVICALMIIAAIGV